MALFGQNSDLFDKWTCQIICFNTVSNSTFKKTLVNLVSCNRPLRDRVSQYVSNFLFFNIFKIRQAQLQPKVLKQANVVDSCKNYKR